MRYGSEVYHHLKKCIKDKYGLDATSVGDEGGFAPNIQNPEEALELLQQAVRNAGYEYVDQIVFGMDVAASEFCKVQNGVKMYDLDFKNPKQNWGRFVSTALRFRWALNYCIEFTLVYPFRLTATGWPSCIKAISPNIR